MATQHYYWPGMNNDITMMIDRCEQCQLVRPSQAREPLQLFPHPSAPMTDVSLDLFHCPKGEFLIMVDRFSNFPFVARLSSTDTSTVTTQLLRWFHEF